MSNYKNKGTIKKEMGQKLLFLFAFVLTIFIKGGLSYI